MMNHKNLVRWAIIMVVVFGLITIAYPLIFKPGDTSLPANTSTKPVEMSQPNLPVDSAQPAKPADSSQPQLPAADSTGH